MIVSPHTPVPIDISIVVVNYNVKEFVGNLFASIRKASTNLNIEVILVDNASIDGSIPFLRAQFPEVHYIANTNNVGFGTANNQAITIARGTYTFILNPDTLLEEHTLEVLKNYLESNPTFGAVGCKLLNPDGTFAPESRRQEPTPLSALGRTLGLTQLFPKSKKWSGYYMNWIPEDQACEVDVLSGACMFYRTDVLRGLGGFDEQFFMYGEDIDLCRRTREAGFKIGYTPNTSIIHYKGESTKKDKLDYVVIFNKAMYQYFQKHYSFTYSTLFKVLIISGIVGRGIVTYLKNLFSKSWQLITDVLVINAVLIPLFIWRYQIEPSAFWDRYEPGYFVINGLISVFYILFASQTGLFERHKFSISPMIKSVLMTFTAVIVITFFLRDYAFSRLILLLGAIGAIALLGFSRFLLRQRSKSKYEGTRLSPLRLLIVGYDDKTSEMIRKLRAQVSWHYEIVGIVAQDESKIWSPIENIPIVGVLADISKIIKMLEADQLLFTAGAMSNTQILNTLTRLENHSVIAKVIPESKDYIIGKSNVEYFDDVALMEVDLALYEPLNQVLKRSFDLIVSALYLLIWFPILPFVVIKFLRKSVDKARIDTLDSTIHLLMPYDKHPWSNRYALFFAVFMGKLSLVGAPIWRVDEQAPVKYKPGLTGLRQLNAHRVFRLEEKQRFELHYVKFYSIWMDFDIIIRTLLSKKPATEM